MYKNQGTKRKNNRKHLLITGGEEVNGNYDEESSTMEISSY